MHVNERIDNGSWEEYKTFSCHPDYRSFSLEEHRLEDYEHDKGRNAAHNVNPNAQSLFATDSKPLIKGTLADKGKIQLLQGSAVEIQAETTTSFSNYDETKSFKTWCLPINLVSHYSPYLKEVFSSFKQSGKRISLHGVPPEVFGLFVEWMYYGSYASPSVVSIFNADAKCWVLGDKLRSIEFKNCAMRRLHEQHTRPTFGRPMTCDDVQYVYSNTSPGSQLRSFYKHFVVEHFGSPDKLLGTSSDWDKLLQNQPEIRILLLKKFRESTFLKSHVESIDKYLGPNNRPIVALRQKKKEAVELATGPESAEGPIFNFDEKSNGKKNSPQQTEAFQLVSTTKNYEGAALKSGWKLGESADNSPKPIFKTIQPKQDPISELDAEPALGHASKCSTCVSKSDDVNKAPETEKGKEPMRGECLDNKKSELDEASTLLG